MRYVISTLLGALLLMGATWYYLQQAPVFPEDALVWRLLLLQAFPSGVALGLAVALALRVPRGKRRALCCFAGGLLALVPPGVWAWLAISGDPLHALPRLWETLVFCVPTLGAVFVLTTWGLLCLRPTRFFSQEKPDQEP
jgi:hypothetical protein